MLLRILVGVILAYALLVLLAWGFQERMAFPAPRGALPDAIELNRLGAQHVELVMRDGTRLAGVYLPPHHSTQPDGQARSPRPKPARRASSSMAARWAPWWRRTRRRLSRSPG